MAEWLGRALQKLLQRFESARCLKKPRELAGFKFFVYLCTVPLFVLNIALVIVLRMEASELFLLKFTLFPLIAWVFLWGYDKLEHLLLHKYFDWTLRVEKSKNPVSSIKKLFKSAWSSDFKGSKKHLQNISSSGFTKFIVAYFLGVGMVQLGAYGWLKVKWVSQF